MSHKDPWNPSKKATARVKDKLPTPTKCPHCGSDVIIQSNDAIYGKKYGEWPWAYVCTDRKGCDSYVGMHPFTNIPLGTLATPSIRDARKKIKGRFYAMLDIRQVSRNEGYRLLAEEMDIPQSECHFGWFDVEACEKAGDALDVLVGFKKKANPNSPFAGLKILLKKG